MHMSFHITKLGSFGRRLSRFADLDGYVPEEGDTPEDMHWEGGIEWDEESWDDYVTEAVAATEEAKKALRDWQDENA
jgi:hypothetical protein